MSWQRTVTIAIFIAGACVAMVLSEHTLAATLVGLGGGLAVPPMSAATPAPAPAPALPPAPRPPIADGADGGKDDLP